MSGRAFLVPCLALLALAPAQARAGEPVTYGPVPAGIAAIVVDERDKTLADMAVAAVDEGRGHRIDAARAQLVALEGAGLRAVATRLARGVPSRQARVHLLEVVAASAHPEADVLLTRAAAEPAPVLRMVAADALGRGRSARAAPALAGLARDPMPGVRIAALRALFALESEAAVQARTALPADTEPDLLTARLRWHARSADRTDALVALAEQAYRRGITPELRMAAAGYLARPATQARLPVLRSILTETAWGPDASRAWQRKNRLPHRGYDAVVMRRVAVDAVLTLLERGDVPARHRARYVDLAVGFVARPVRMDPKSKEPEPEQRLRRRLPDLGEAIVKPVTRRLMRSTWEDELRAARDAERDALRRLDERQIRWDLAKRNGGDPHAHDALEAERRKRKEALAAARARVAQVTAAFTAAQLGGETSDAFVEPRAGVLLLRELGAATALPIFRRILAREGTYGSWVRASVAAALRDFGTVGDEALARALLAGPDRNSLKIDILHALEKERAPWAIPTLASVVRGEDGELRSHALSVLERRPEPEAHRLLEDDLFRRMERPHDRLAGLVAKGDDAALATLKRALDDERSLLRKAALSQFTRVRALRTQKGKALLDAQGPRVRSPQEIQQFLYALLRFAPAEAVAWVRKNWETLGSTSARYTSLRQLQETRGDDAAWKAAMDFALERLAATDDPRLPVDATGIFRGRWDHRPKEVEAYWRKLLEARSADTLVAAIAGIRGKGAPDFTDVLLPLLERANAHEALPETEDAAAEVSLAIDIVQTLRTQPWTKVEPVLITLALEPLTDFEVRLEAALSLAGRLSDAARGRLLAWLTGTKANEGDKADTRNSTLQMVLADAVGRGGDATVAAALEKALGETIEAYYDEAMMQRIARGAPPRPEAALVDRVRALTLGIARTGYEPAMVALLGRVFDPRFATYARAIAAINATRLRFAGSTAAAAKPSSLRAQAYLEDDSLHTVPLEISHILGMLKALDDDVLARGLRTEIERAHLDGRLARFPAHYLMRIYAYLRDAETGTKPRAGEAVLEALARQEPTDAAPLYHALVWQLELTTRAGRWPLAATQSAALARIALRSNEDDVHPGTWLHHRAAVDALRGAALVTEGKTDAARALFKRALLRAPNEPRVLNGVAWYQARVAFDLAQAERTARRAVLLEQRTGELANLNTLDTLAYILLLRGKAAEGLALMEPRMTRRQLRDGLIHLHLAQMQAAVGRLRDAQRSLVNALVWDRTLAEGLEKDPHLAPLREKARLAKCVEVAKARRDEIQRGNW